MRRIDWSMVGVWLASIAFGVGCWAMIAWVTYRVVMGIQGGKG